MKNGKPYKKCAFLNEYTVGMDPVIYILARNRFLLAGTSSVSFECV